MDAELGAEEGGRAPGQEPGTGRSLALALEALVEAADALNEGLVAGEGREAGSRHLLEEAYRVPPTPEPAVDIDLGEDLGPVGRPRPPVIHGDGGKGPDGGGKASRERFGGRSDVVATVSQGTPPGT